MGLIRDNRSTQLRYTFVAILNRRQTHGVHVFPLGAIETGLIRSGQRSEVTSWGRTHAWEAIDITRGGGKSTLAGVLVLHCICAFVIMSDDRRQSRPQAVEVPATRVLVVAEVTLCKRRSCDSKTAPFACLCRRVVWDRGHLGTH
jgi:hypothetical protein